MCYVLSVKMKRFIQNLVMHKGNDPQFVQLESEPRPAISPTPFTFPTVSSYPPPPIYRSSSYTDDATTMSECSSGYNSATMIGKRRTSWSNLVESNDNLNSSQLNAYPKASRPSITSSTSTPRPFVIQPPDPQGMMTVCKIPSGQGSYAPSQAQSSRRDSVANQSCSSEYIAMPKGSLKGSLCKLNESAVEVPNSPRVKRDRMTELRQCCQRPCTKTLLIILATLIVTAIVLGIVLTQGGMSKTFDFSWLPPFSARKGQSMPSNVKLDLTDSDEARFKLSGNPPFKGDFTSIYDFKTRKVAIIDSTLKRNGRNLVCFVMDLNATSMSGIDALKTSAQYALSKKEQLHGWKETWNFAPGPYFGNASALFQSGVPECNGARWIQLNYTNVDQKDRRCTDCHDFCLPEYGIERDAVRGENYLNVIRRDCFYLFVPEWRGFPQSNEQNQRDFDNFYSTANTNTVSGQPAQTSLSTMLNQQPNRFETKWISLQQAPQQVANATGHLFGQAYSQAGNMASNLASNVQGTISGAAHSLFGANGGIQNGYQQNTNQQNGGTHNGFPPNSNSNIQNGGSHNGFPQNGQVQMPPSGYNGYGGGGQVNMGSLGQQNAPGFAQSPVNPGLNQGQNQGMQANPPSLFPQHHQSNTFGASGSANGYAPNANGQMGSAQQSDHRSGIMSPGQMSSSGLNTGPAYSNSGNSMPSNANGGYGGTVQSSYGNGNVGPNTNFGQQPYPNQQHTPSLSNPSNPSLSVPQSQAYQPNNGQHNAGGSGAQVSWNSGDVVSSR